MARLQREAEDAHATGVAGVDIAEHRHAWGGTAIEFLAMGTAIVRDDKSHTASSPAPVLDLND